MYFRLSWMCRRVSSSFGQTGSGQEVDTERRQPGQADPHGQPFSPQGDCSASKMPWQRNGEASTLCRPGSFSPSHLCCPNIPPRHRSPLSYQLPSCCIHFHIPKPLDPWRIPKRMSCTPTTAHPKLQGLLPSSAAGEGWGWSPAKQCPPQSWVTACTVRVSGDTGHVLSFSKYI